MIKRYFIKPFLLAVFFYMPFSSNAWGVLGHRIVGQIADSYLTKHTKKEIQKILGYESIAMVSNWPDFIKSDRSYSYLSPWHYINLKAGLNETQLKAYLAIDSIADAYTKIKWLSAELKNKNLELEKKGMYLRLLIHLVGDLHQPLHTGRYEDLGGNKIRVSWFKDDINLHQVWDERLIDFQQLSYTEYAMAINHTTKEQRKEWGEAPIEDWVWQSYQIAENVYSGVKDGDKLGFRYNFDYISTLNNQLLKGGVRLAALLNDIFKD